MVVRQLAVSVACMCDIVGAFAGATFGSVDTDDSEYMGTVSTQGAIASPRVDVDSRKACLQVPGVRSHVLWLPHSPDLQLHAHL